MTKVTPPKMCRRKGLSQLPQRPGTGMFRRVEFCHVRGTRHYSTLRIDIECQFSPASRSRNSPSLLHAWCRDTSTPVS